MQLQFLGREFTQWPGLVMPLRASTAQYQALQQFVTECRQYTYGSVLDLGSGSGVLGISIAQGRPLVMVDTNPKAVELSALNLRGDQGQALLGSWFEPVTGQFDLIIANPPYGRAEDWDPQLAEQWGIPRDSVVSEDQGMAEITEIMSQCRPYMAHKLCLIHSEDQSHAVNALGWRYQLAIMSRSVCAGLAMTVYEKIG